MGALSSLSKSATLICWYVAVIATFGFGAIFLFGWLSEEFATSDKWKARRKLLIIVAIIGVAGEQLATLAEFVFSEHLQTIDDRQIAALEKKSAWRHLNPKQRTELANLFAPLKGIAVVLSANTSDTEATGFAREIEVPLQNAGVQVSERFGMILPSGGALPSGLWIQVTPDDLSKAQGGVLQRALQSEGIEAPGALFPAPKPEKDKPPSTTVEIFIGGRPE